MKQYEKKPDQSPVIAVQINLALDAGGISYRKWGGEQWAKQGDWLVDNNGEIYTIDAESFARTYKQVGPGQYIKVAKVWAETTSQDGYIETKEGRTQYSAGCFLVYNEPDRKDGYALSPDAFYEMYQPVAN